MRTRDAQPSLTLRIHSAELRTAPPTRAESDLFVARLCASGLGGTSYVLGQRGQHPPERIVLGYSSDGHERVWRRARSRSDRDLTYVLVDDDSSTGYITVA